LDAICRRFRICWLALLQSQGRTGAAALWYTMWDMAERGRG